MQLYDRMEPVVNLVQWVEPDREERLGDVEVQVEMGVRDPEESQVEREPEEEIYRQMDHREPLDQFHRVAHRNPSSK